MCTYIEEEMAMYEGDGLNALYLELEDARRELNESWVLYVRAAQGKRQLVNFANKIMQISRAQGQTDMGHALVDAARDFLVKKHTTRINQAVPKWKLSSVLRASRKHLHAQKNNFELQQAKFYATKKKVSKRALAGLLKRYPAELSKIIDEYGDDNVLVVPKENEMHVYYGPKGPFGLQHGHMVLLPNLGQVLYWRGPTDPRGWINVRTRV